MNRTQNIPEDEKHYEMVLGFLSRLKGDLKMLEVGAGRCILRNILPENIHYYSMDMSGNQDYIFDLNKGKMPIKNQSFDIVLCLETLEHVLYPHKVIKELRRVGKKSAVFIISLPNEYNILQRFLYFLGLKTKTNVPFRVIEDNLHIHTPRVKDIINFISEYFEIQEVRFLWQSRNKNQNYFIYLLDKIFKVFANIRPSLFTRLVIVFAKNKNGYKEI